MSAKGLIRARHCISATRGAIAPEIVTGAPKIVMMLLGPSGTTSTLLS